MTSLTSIFALDSRKTSWNTPALLTVGCAPRTVSERALNARMRHEMEPTRANLIALLSNHLSRFPMIFTD